MYNNRSKGFRGFTRALNVSAGFTLIELLVVVAIIGILSSIVLASLNSARTRAKDARVMASMAQIRTLAETLYDGAAYPSTFVTPCAGTVCLGTAPSCTGGSASTEVNLLDGDMRASQGLTCASAVKVSTAVGTNGGLLIVKSATNNAYAAFASLPSTNQTKGWCVDSVGSSREYTLTGANPTATACP